MGQWQGASAGSVATVSGGPQGPSTHARIRLTGLVPNGVEGDLLAAREVFFSVVYHFAGMTYHPFPDRGEFFTHGGEEPCRSTYGLDAMCLQTALQAGTRGGGRGRRGVHHRALQGDP